MTERTLFIVKPDAVEKHVVGRILAIIEAGGLVPVAGRFTRLAPGDAERFYAVHRERPFFNELCTFMTRGPVVVLALARENAVQHLRNTIGATDPAKAAPGSVRKLYGKNVGENAVHGSDSVENGALECGYFFPGMNLV